MFTSRGWRQIGVVLILRDEGPPLQLLMSLGGKHRWLTSSRTLSRIGTKTGVVQRDVWAPAVHFRIDDVHQGLWVVVHGLRTQCATPPQGCDPWPSTRPWTAHLGCAGDVAPGSERDPGHRPPRRFGVRANANDTFRYACITSITSTSSWDIHTN